MCSTLSPPSEVNVDVDVVDVDVDVDVDVVDVDVDVKDGFTKKKVAVLLDFVQIRGGESCPNFLSPFHKCIFGHLKESISYKMPII